MGLFKKIREVFSSKPSAEQSSEQLTVLEKKPSHVDSAGRRFVDRYCKACNQLIGEERYSHQQGFYFHKKCYKTALKLALNGRKKQ